MVRVFCLFALVSATLAWPFSTLAQSDADGDDEEVLYEPPELGEPGTAEADNDAEADDTAEADSDAEADGESEVNPWLEFEPAADAPADEAVGEPESVSSPLELDDGSAWSPRALWSRGLALSTPRKTLVASGAGLLVAGLTYSIVSASSQRWVCSDDGCGTQRTVRGGLPVALGSALVSGAAFYTAYRYDDWFTRSVSEPPSDIDTTPVPFVVITDSGAGVGMAMRF